MSGAPEGEAALRGLHRWLTSPSLWGGLVGVALAVLYGLANLELPPGTGLYFAGLLIPAAVVAVWCCEQVEQRGLRVIRGLGEGKLPPSTENLRLAVKEAFELPGRSFWWGNFIPWVATCLVVGLLYRLAPGVSWTLSARIACLGATLGSLSSGVAYFLVAARARVAVKRVAALGLPAHEVIRAVAGRPQYLRRRLLWFAAVAMVVPSLFVADLVLARFDKALKRLLSSPDIDAQQQALAQFSMGPNPAAAGIALLVVGVALWTAYLFGTALSRSLRAIGREAARIAKGDLREPRLIVAEDEVWAASAAVSIMQAQLAQALAELQRAGRRITATTEQLKQSSSAQRTGAVEQTTALNETSATTEELARSARQIAQNTHEVSVLAQKTFGAAQASHRNSEAFFASMLRMREDNQRIADSVLKLNKRVQQIGRIVEFINEVGDKSDLLALNAELEGTKAGEVGRGFSLVAAEMRRLVETVFRSTHEIGQLIEEIRDGTNAAVMATESGLKAMDAGSATAREVIESLNVILDEAGRTSEAVRTISLATKQQETGTDQLAAAMTEILRITQDGSAATEEIGHANTELSQLARDLQAVVDRFQLAEEAGPSSLSWREEGVQVDHG